MIAPLFVLFVLSASYFFIGGICASVYLDSGASNFKGILAGLFWPVILFATYLDN